MTDTVNRKPWVEAEAFGTMWEKNASSLLAIQIGLDDYLVGESSDHTQKRYKFDDIDVSIKMPINIPQEFNDRNWEYAEISIRFPNKIKKKFISAMNIIDEYHVVNHQAVNKDDNYTVIEFSASSKNNMLWILMDIFKFVTGQEKFIKNMYTSWE